MEACNKQDEINLSFTEDEAHWLFCIKSNNISNLQNSFIYLIKMLITSVNDAQFKLEENNEIIVSMKKI